MRRMFGVAMATVGALLLATQPASAGYWAWLEQFSGPGPLRARTPPLLTTWCAQDGDFLPSPLAGSDTFHQRQWAAATEVALFTPEQKAEDAYKRLLANPTPAESFAVARDQPFASLVRAVRTARPAQDGAAVGPGTLPTLTLKQAIDFYRTSKADHGLGHQDQKLICGYFDYGSFTNDVNEVGQDLGGFPKVTARLFDLGGVGRLHDGIDIGGGFGLVHFSGASISETRMTLTPFRSVIRPLLLVVPEHVRKRWMGVLSLYWKETYIIGELSAADFGVDPKDNPYKQNGELVRSFGVTLDLSFLVHPLQR